jgi:hypothetical protein
LATILEGEPIQSMTIPCIRALTADRIEAIDIRAIAPRPGAAMLEAGE